MTAEGLAIRPYVHMARAFFTLLSVATALKSHGFDYLQVQGGFDRGPGEPLVSFYHLVQVGGSDGTSTGEVRLEVSLPRDGDLTVPSLYPLFRGADWQERETFDLFGINYSGHPHPKRLLMPEALIDCKRLPAAPTKLSAT